MQCPTDATVLVMSERSGIEIDYCPTCRGVWLDRGELDKIIDRVATTLGGATPAVTVPPPSEVPSRRDDIPYDDRDRARPDPGYDRRRKRRSFLDDLFDFD